MVSIYLFGIRLFALLVGLGSFWNAKAKQWADGRRGIFGKIEASLKNRTEKKRYWFHASSLGEYELCKPLIRELKRSNLDCLVIVTFFSPSGFEGEGIHDEGDFFFYLPLDTPKNAKRFLEILNPHAAFFAKYDLWYFYLAELKRKEIPSILFSAAFRKEQFYFKWYGRIFLNRIREIDKIFVQGENSKSLLEEHGVKSTVVGDSRFDRVSEIVEKSRENPLISDFIGKSKAIIVGSCWPSDLHRLLPAMDKFPELKVVLAPHDVSKSSIVGIEAKIGDESIRYSMLQIEDHTSKKYLIIDNIGMLSSLYRYGTIAYVGGGFKEGLHNILEPAAWGIPVLYGPEINKYPEAIDLVKLGGGFVVNDSVGIQNLVEGLMDSKKTNMAGEKARLFVEGSTGSAKKIMEELNDL